MLTFQNLYFGYGRKRQLFDGLSFAFPEGKTLLLGPNGSGKSTLFALASGLLRPKWGHVTNADGSVALMPQTVPVFRGLTVREQVAYAGWLAGKASKDSWIQSEEILSQVGLNDKKNDKSGNLSGGQLRRMGIASTLMSDSSILLLDEPTAGLDLQQSANFYQVLEKVSQDKSVIISSHQIDGLAGFFDNVVLLLRGAVCFCGTFAEFIDVGSKLGATNQNDALVAAYSSFVGSDE